MYPSRRQQTFAEMSGARIVAVLSVLLLLAVLLFLVIPADGEDIEDGGTVVVPAPPICATAVQMSASYGNTPRQLPSGELIIPSVSGWDSS